MMLFILFIVLLVTFLIMVLAMNILQIYGIYVGNMYGAITFTIGVISLISLVFVIIEEPQSPTAMDVYRGRTTLEITYKDGVPIDTVVVFKKKR